MPFSAQPTPAGVTVSVNGRVGTTAIRMRDLRKRKREDPTQEIVVTFSEGQELSVQIGAVQEVRQRDVATVHRKAKRRHTKRVEARSLRTDAATEEAQAAVSAHCPCNEVTACSAAQMAYCVAG